HRGRAKHQKHSAKNNASDFFPHEFLLLFFIFNFYPSASLRTCFCVVYLMTLSALASTFGGIVRPICLAFFKLITSSNLVGCSTGRSAGFAPLRILSTWLAARR